MRARIGCLTAVLLGGITVGAVTAGPGVEPGAGSRDVEGSLVIDAAGEARLDVGVRFPAAEMADVKAQSPDAKRFLTRLCPSRPDYEVDRSAEVSYDATAPTLKAAAVLHGFARHRGAGRWEADLGADYLEGGADPAIPGGRQWTFDVSGTLDGEHDYMGAMRVVLPEGAVAPRWDREEHKLLWGLAHEIPAGDGSLSGRIQCAPRVISGAYKVYTVAKGFTARHVPLANGEEIVLGADLSTPWVGRLVLSNAGPGGIFDLRVRWKLEDYTAEWSPAEKFPELRPGQTVVSVYYPVIQPSVARLRDDTKANLHVKWTWTDAAGKAHEDDDAGRVTLLGVNNFAFSDLGEESQFGTFAETIRNAPLLAAWVSRNDGVVNQFGAMANKNAGGVAASVSDENAQKAMQHCYELMLMNNITYQSPPALVKDRGRSFDASEVQTVRFPRDVIKNRSGTCIDLAILYASMLNAVGLHPVLVLIDGHCFPAVILPSQRIVAVESTGVGGGLAGGFLPFRKVLALGTREFDDARRSGRYLLVPVQEMWEAEILTPELEELPADILQRWGVSGTPPAGFDPDPPDPILGTWGGDLTQEVEGGGSVTYPIAITIARDPDATDETSLVAASRSLAKVPSGGGFVELEVVENFVGVGADGAVSLRGAEKAMTWVATRTRVAPDPPVDRFLARVVDGRLVGRLGSDAEGWIEFTLKKVP